MSLIVIRDLDIIWSFMRTPKLSGLKIWYSRVLISQWWSDWLEGDAVVLDSAQCASMIKHKHFVVHFNCIKQLTPSKEFVFIKKICIDFFLKRTWSNNKMNVSKTVELFFFFIELTFEYYSTIVGFLKRRIFFQRKSFFFFFLFFLFFFLCWL